MSKRCIHCGAEIHEQSSFCHFCAQSQIEKQKPKIPQFKLKKVLSFGMRCVIAITLLIGCALGVGSGTTATLDPSSLPEGRSVEAIPAYEGPPEPEPEVSLKAEPSGTPEVLTGPNGELIYSDSDDAYRLSLSFYRSTGMNPPSEHDITLEQMTGTGNFTYSQLFVTNRMGTVVSEEFLEKIRFIEVGASFPDGTPVPTEGPLINEEDPLALRSVMVFFGDSFGEITVHWTITMGNGDILKLRHTLTIVEAVSEDSGSYFADYCGTEDFVQRKLSDEQLAELKQADIDVLQAAISTVADAVAYLDQFPHGRNSFYDAIHSDFLMDVADMLELHRTESTGPDVYTSFTGWCLADDYPEARYLISTGTCPGFTWIYHSLLMPSEDGFRVVTPAGHSKYWNCVFGFEEVPVSTPEGIEEHLIPIHAGMTDDSGMFLYHLYSIEVGKAKMNFWMDGNYLVTTTDAEELYRMPEETGP